MQKRILIYGEFWPGTLPSLLKKELVDRGHIVSIFDFTKIVPGISDRKIFNRIKRRVFTSFYEWQVNATFLRQAKVEKPDVIIVSKGLNLYPRTVEELSQLGGKLINWNPDDFFNSKNTNDNLVNSVRYYDLVVSSRPHLFQEYQEHGIKKSLFVDWYYVPELHFPRQTSFKYDLTFVGSWSPLREEFISHIVTPIDIWGGGWERSSLKFKSLHRVNSKIVSQVEMSSIFSESKYNLNLITHENRDYSNLRFFEVCASGGLLITEKNESSMSYLVDREDCLMYDTVDDVNKMLVSEFDFGAIAASGYQKIVGGKNSFADRVDQLLNVIQ